MGKERTNLPDDQPFVAIEEESLFARDIDGQLVRIVAATSDDFNEDVPITIDGHAITVKKAVPLKDAQGNIVRDAEGRAIPRATTIYDAANEIFIQRPGDRNPIPTLCHKEHMQPAGVCRVCVVEVFRNDRGQRRPGGKLVPACHHRVEPGMEVQTIESANDPAAGERVRSAVGLLTELLVADHLPTGFAAEELSHTSELAALARRLGIESSRFASHDKGATRDRSSLQIQVDHAACILCDRCVRACNQVKENLVIGRNGKGYSATIAFGLNQPMRDSGCVSCGECAVSCPTDALTFTSEFIERQKEFLHQDLQQEQASAAVKTGRKRKAASADETDEILTAEQLVKLPLFSGIPFKFFQFNGGAVVRRKLKAGDVLCREGEYGKTAFILEQGRFEVFLQASKNHVQSEAAPGILGRLGFLTSRLVSRGDKGETRFRRDGGASAAPDQRVVMTPDDLILGEMTCMNRYPRSATVMAIEDGQVLEIRRNVLYMLQRNPVSREILDRVYRERVLVSQLRNLSILSDLPEEEQNACCEYLKDKLELVRVDPGQTVFRQDELADALYLVRLGFVKVTQRYGLDERVINYLGPGSYFGEIGLLSSIPGLFDEEDFRGRRTASCSALDDVELIRIRGKDFAELIGNFPSLREALLKHAEQLVERDKHIQQKATTESSDFLAQGLFNANSLLVLDLESCTRCDECTRACSDTHDGVTRLIREGLRFDKFLVASSCRSCLDPYCMVGCPVDAIHREGSLEVLIEDHCIGCGLCATNCPYGNINMHGFEESRTDPETKRRHAVIQQKATTCDLCRNVRGKEPSCVYACPHHAAFRMSGEELFQIVGGV